MEASPLRAYCNCEGACLDVHGLFEEALEFQVHAFLIGTLALPFGIAEQTSDEGHGSSERFMT